MLKLNGDYVIFVVDGGMGKVIQSTVVLRGIKKKYPEKQIIVLCGYPNLLKLNPNKDEVYLFGSTPHFYDHFIAGGKSIPLRAEPYFHPDYLTKKKHLTECWCEMLDVPFDNPIPDFYLTKAEDRDALDFIRSKDGPVFLTQFVGGPPPQVDEKGQIVQMPPKMYVRSLPSKIVQGVCSDMKEEGYFPMVMCAPSQPLWEGVERISYPIRQSLALIKHSHKLLFIDSVGQHVAAALGKKAVVCWAGTSPDCLGYAMHTNLRQQECETPECHRPNSFFFDMTTVGQWECPYGEPCVENYDQQDILDALHGLCGGVAPLGAEGGAVVEEKKAIDG